MTEAPREPHPGRLGVEPIDLPPDLASASVTPRDAETVIKEWLGRENADVYASKDNMTHRLLAALNANGFSLVPTGALNELLAAAREACAAESWREGPKANWYVPLTDARLAVRAAVVEAVGPTT